MRESCGVLLVLACLVGVVGISSPVSATIFASGDNTPAYYAAYDDNNAFFANILQGGTSVLVHEPSTTAIGNQLNTYYNSLPGVSSSYVEGTVLTDDLLSGVDLLVIGMFGGALTGEEINVIDSLLDSGGSVYFMGDYTAPVTNINNVLTALGSNLLLYGEITDTGTWYATGSQIAADPFTAGVSSFEYGATYGVSGGTALFYDSTGRPFIAYESGTGPAVPEPMTLSLVCVGLMGLAGLRKRVL